MVIINVGFTSKLVLFSQACWLANWLVTVAYQLVCRCLNIICFYSYMGSYKPVTSTNNNMMANKNLFPIEIWQRFGAAELCFACCARVDTRHMEVALMDMHACSNTRIVYIMKNLLTSSVAAYYIIRTL